ncbi:MAG: DUF6064 family protein [Gemmatimonadota bacterium]
MFRLPFTADEFFGVFASYNNAVWPAQIVLTAAAVAALVLIFLKGDRSDRAITGFLAVLWAWTGIAYHLAYFSSINRGAYLFGALFVVQAALFGWMAVRDRLSFAGRLDAFTVVGGLLILYALLVYPLLGRATGHLYPATPTFGAPCPSVILTFGLLLFARGRVPGWLLVIPFVWGIVGLSAVAGLGVLQDIGLFVSAVVATPMILVRNRRAAVAAAGEVGAPAT